MKKKYNIRFKHGINYRGEIDVLNLKLLDDKPKPEIRLKNFDDALDSMNTRTLRQLRNFIAREPIDLPRITSPPRARYPHTLRHQMTSVACAAAALAST